MKKFTTSKILLLLTMIMMVGCGSDSSQNAESVGEVKVLMTDNPAIYEAVYVTVQEVRAHKQGDCEITEEDEPVSEDSNETVDTNASATLENPEECDDDGGWVTIAQPKKTYDLLALQNGVTTELGEANISVGQYTQLRFILGNQEDNATNILGEAHPYANYLIVTGDDVSELKAPSMKLQLKHGFEVKEDQPYEMTIDFDANKSIMQTGNGSWKLLPVLSVDGRAIEK